MTEGAKVHHIHHPSLDITDDWTIGNPARCKREHWYANAQLNARQEDEIRIFTEAANTGLEHMMDNTFSVVIRPVKCRA